MASVIVHVMGEICNFTTIEPAFFASIQNNSHES